MIKEALQYLIEQNPVWFFVIFLAVASMGR